MAQKTIFGLLFISLLVILLGTTVWQILTPNPPDSSSNQPVPTNPPVNQPTGSSPSSNESLVKNWNTYTAPSLGFSMKHPEDIEIRTPNQTTRRFQFSDSNTQNNTDSETTDGFTMTVSVDQAIGTQYSSLKAYAQAKFKAQSQNITQKQSPQSIAIANKPAYVYSTQSSSEGKRMYYVFLHRNTGRGYQVSVAKSDNASQSDNKYNNIIDAMLDSLSFTGVTKPDPSFEEPKTTN